MGEIKRYRASELAKLPADSDDVVLSSAHDALLAELRADAERYKLALERISSGNRRIVADSGDLSIGELIMGYEAAADVADAALNKGAA